VLAKKEPDGAIIHSYEGNACNNKGTELLLVLHAFVLNTFYRFRPKKENQPPKLEGMKLI
jgi:hypothetical protein